VHLIFTGLAGAFAPASPLPALNEFLNFPIFLQEMVMAVWLIAKGFNPSAIAAVSEQTSTRPE
jgi:hypothetical protein